MNSSDTGLPPSTALSYQGHTLAFFRTQEIPCPYRPEMAQFLVVPADDREHVPYDFYMAHNFRRDSEHIIRPNCANCTACQSYRVNAEQFELTRRYRRNLKQNQDLTYQIEPSSAINQYQPLYHRYQAQRHPETTSQHTVDDLEGFTADFANTVLGVARLADEVVAVMVIDNCRSTLSAVYTFYDPDLNKRGLGSYMILQLIRLAQSRQYAYVYLGYYVADCQKLNYKVNFTPGEHYIPERLRWVPYHKNTPA